MGIMAGLEQGIFYNSRNVNLCLEKDYLTESIS